MSEHDKVKRIDKGVQSTGVQGVGKWEGISLIIERKTIEVEKRISDYCKGCEYYSAVTEEFTTTVNGIETVKQLEYCLYANQCDALYRRVLENGKDK